MALPLVAVGFQTVAATQRGEQAPVPEIRECKPCFYRVIGLRGDRKSFLTLSVAAAAALRSPTVVAPSNNLEILRNFSRSSCSVVMARFRGLNHRKQYAEVRQKTPQTNIFFP